MTKFFSVVSFGFGLLGAVSAHALTCENMPSCAELGYSQNIPLACTKVVKCPFDITYKKCLNCGLSLTCADGGYEEAPLGAGYDCTVKPFEKLTCYDCVVKINKTCSIGDVYYADGSCGKADDYDGSKTAIGVVYMLSDSKYGMPIEAESSEHGRVINLHDLTLNRSTYAFDPANPYNNSHAYVSWGLYETTSGATHYNENSLLTAFQNNDPKLYTAGMTDTQTIANATSTYSSCTSGSYAPGTKNYNSYCNPTAAKAALAFYPPNVASNDPIAGAGNWYVPTMGELAWLYGINVSAMTSGSGTSGATGTNKTLINNTLTTLAAKGEPTAVALTNSYYWASSEYSTAPSWLLYMNNGSRSHYFKYINEYLRVSLAF